VVSIEELMEIVGRLVATVLRPENVATLSLVWGLLYKGVKLLNKKLDANQDATISAINSKLTTLEKNQKDSIETLQKDVLRLQILDGIDSKRLSSSEVLFFFDRYKALGGNSFVDERVKQYVKGE
jgi:hypothetical protein